MEELERLEFTFLEDFKEADISEKKAPLRRPIDELAEFAAKAENALFDEDQLIKEIAVRKPVVVPQREADIGTIIDRMGHIVLAVKVTTALFLLSSRHKK